ncbi:hypothetical protein U0070_011376 [Myodes glareolus]|uniref:DUF1899 domain-containing protein n=1 Tax=Myodes glareolus TaxID=447135 RepID=A0AAW0HYD0_MYOGA
MARNLQLGKSHFSENLEVQTYPDSPSYKPSLSSWHGKEKTLKIILHTSQHNTFCTVNPKLLAVTVETSTKFGRGSFLVFPLSKMGHTDKAHPTVHEHTGSDWMLAGFNKVVLVWSLGTAKQLNSLYSDLTFYNSWNHRDASPAQFAKTRWGTLVTKQEKDHKGAIPGHVSGGQQGIHLQFQLHE